MYLITSWGVCVCVCVGGGVVGGGGGQKIYQVWPVPLKSIKSPGCKSEKNSMQIKPYKISQCSHSQIGV